MNTGVVNLLGGVAFVIVVLLCVAATMFLALSAWRTARARGYSPPAAAVVLVVGLALAVKLEGVLFDALGGQMAATAVGFVVLTFGTAAIAAVIAFVLPRRKGRSAGIRAPRFPVAAGLLSLAALGVAGVLSLLAIPLMFPGVVSFGQIGVVVAPLVSLTVALVVMASRARAQIRASRQLAAVRRDDVRPPVLYLREFGQERQPFVSGERRELLPYLKGAQKWVPLWAVPAGAQQAMVDFEAYFDAAMTRALGPFIALGSPEDYLQPIGAAREYAADRTWRERFGQLAGQAKAIVLQPGTSDQLCWEFDFLLRHRLAIKLFVIVGPLTFSTTWMWTFWRLYGWKQARWPRFRALMNGVGYRLPIERPGAASVICFDADGTASTVAVSREGGPEAYAQAIRTRLTEDRAAPHSAPPPARLAPPAPERLPPPIGDPEGSSARREVAIIAGLLCIVMPPVFFAAEMTPAWNLPALGFQWSVPTCFVLTAVFGGLGLSLLFDGRPTWPGTLSGAVAGCGALAALSLAPLLADSLGLQLHLVNGGGRRSGIAMLAVLVVGALPGVFLYLLLESRCERSGKREPRLPLAPPAEPPPSIVAWTYAIETDRRVEDLRGVLNVAGPWRWQVRHADAYGNVLSCRPEKGVRIRLHRRDSRCTALLQLEPPSPAGQASIDATFRGLMQSSGIALRRLP